MRKKLVFLLKFGKGEAAKTKKPQQIDLNLSRFKKMWRISDSNR